LAQTSSNILVPNAKLSSFAFRAIGFAQFGGVGDGSFDNSAALSSFGSYARAESAAGRGVELHCSPGVYDFDGTTHPGTLFDIQRLRIVGYGAVFRNTSKKATPWFTSCFPSLRGGSGPLINSTSIGDTAVTLKPASQYSLHPRFAVGDWAMVGSLDIQFYGYPPNLDQFDFVRVTAINRDTGVITIDPPLGYAHRDDFPDGGNPDCGGRARIWPLGGIGSPGGTWDLEHIFEGIEIQKGASNTTYISISGRKLKFVDCVLPGVSPSIVGSFEVIGGVLTDDNEPDKLVGNVLIDGTDVRKGIAFQSSSIDRVTLRNGRGGVLTGMTKNTLVQNWDAPYLTENVAGQNYGAARNLTVEASIIRAMPYFQAFRPTPGANIVDGTNVSFSNGTFSVLKQFSGLHAWGLVLGETVSLSGPMGIYTGDLGNGIVTRIYEDSTKVYFETTLPFASMPSWANGDVRLQRNWSSTYVNCHGCNAVSSLSQAAQRGKRWWESFSETFAGRTPASGSFINSPMGDLTRIRIDVVQASSVANSVLKIVCISPGAYVSAAMASPQSVEINIDATVTGVRDFTQTTLSGKATSDAVMLNGVTQATLPVGRWYPGLSWAYSGLTPINYPPYQLPIIKIELGFDAGFVRSPGREP